MKNKTHFKKNAVVTSILTILILCLASIVMPTINGIRALEIQNNVKKLNNIDNFSKEDFSLFKEQLQNDKNKYITLLLNRYIMDELGEFSYSDFLEIYEFIGSPDITKTENIKNIIKETISILKQLQNVVYYNGDSYEINPQLMNLIDRYNFGVESETFNDAYTDFTWYWDKYTKSIDNWNERFFVDNWQDWFNKVKSHADEILNSNIIPLVFSLFLCALPFPASIIGWILIANVLYQAYDFLDYIREGYYYYAILKTNEINIVIHVVENTTEKNGINGLWENDGIEAKNTNAIIKCDGAIGKTDELFTYYLGPALGTNETGWYTLRNRDIAEEQDRDYKAPHPPCNWTIEIKGNEDYEGSGIIPIDYISRNSTVIKEIPLEPK